MAVEGEAGPPPARLPRRRRLRLDLTTPTLLGRPARVPSQLGVPQAVLEVREDVADRLGDHRRARVPPGVLPGALRYQAQVRPSARADCSVLDELPVAGARLESDPGRPGRDQHVPVLDGTAVGGSPDLPTALQQVRRHARPRLRLAPLCCPADLRFAREPRPAPPRGRDRPRRQPPPGVPEGDTAAVPARDHGRVPLRLHPDTRRVRHAVARRRTERLHVRQPDRRPLRNRVPRLGDRLGARDLPLRRRHRADRRLRALPAATAGNGRLMDVALSRNGRIALRALFVLVVLFLYLPIVILLIFSFNNSELPSFPLSGFTLHWYHQFLTNGDLRGALETSAIIAAISSVGAVVLGVLASVALTRRRVRGRAAVSALLLSPLVIPYVVFGISLLLLFHTVGIPRSILTVVIGHIVISLPYAILVLVPRLEQIDVSLEEAAYDLGASRLRTFRSITLPLILPAVVSAFLIAFTTSFDEYAVASFVVGTRTTFPIYLYSALRFPNQLPQVIAVAVVVITLSLIVVVAAEVGRRVAERRLGTLDSTG